MIDKIRSESERDELKDFLLKQKLSYDGFEMWVNNAIEEIKLNKWYAYGCFDDKSEIVGDCIYRISAGHILEIRNLFIIDSSRGMGFGKELLKEIEEEALEKGCKEIRIDTKKTEMMIFLLKNGYYPCNTDGENVILRKILNPRYSGVNDLELIGRWIVIKRFGYDLDEEHPNVDGKNFDGSFIRKIDGFEEKALMEAKNHKKSVDVDLLRPLREAGVGYDKFFFAPAFTERARNYARDNGIKIFDRMKIEELSGIRLDSSILEREGFIQPIKPYWYQNLVTIYKREGKGIFIKGGGSLSIEHGKKFLFYQTRPEMKLSAVAKIIRIEYLHPTIVWNKYKKLLAFDDEEEFVSYYKEKIKVNVILFDELNEYQNGLKLYELKECLRAFSPMGGQYISKKDMEAIHEQQERIYRERNKIQDS